MKVTALIVAGGSGTRMKKEKNKVFLPLLDKTIIEHTLEPFFSSDYIDDIIIVTRPEDFSECSDLFPKPNKPLKVVFGGKTRQESVYNGLKEADCDIVVIHDAARPLIEKEIIEKSIFECKEHRASAVGVPCVDTLKRTDSDGFINETIDRKNIYRIQTPQTFFIKDMMSAHNSAIKDCFEVTDDCALYEQYIGKIKIVPGSELNIKITFPSDILFAEAILKGNGDVL